MTETPSNVADHEELLPGEELVPEDDAVIGRAFRWSMVVLLVLGAVGAGVIWYATRPKPQPPPVAATYVKPVPIEHDLVTPPAVHFTDVTDEAGIDFVHVNGAMGERLLPETMGGGCAFFDYDGDGDQDVLLVNSAYWPGERPPDVPEPTTALYSNDGTGHFQNVTATAGLNVCMYGMGAAVGDCDNDGDVDVFIAAVGSNRLFRNDGGVFHDATAEARVGGEDDSWSASAGFFDYDHDGDLDLFVCNYVRWSKEIDYAVDYRLVGVGRAYGPPTNFEGSHSYLYRNNGHGVFDDVSEQAGIQILNPATGRPAGKALAVLFNDFGDDGLIDVMVANDTVGNFLFRNNGDGTFKEVGAASGIAYDNMGNATGAMGIDAADLRDTGRPAIGIGNFANEMTSLYMTQGDAWQFTDAAIAEGIGGPTRRVLSFGLFFFDYDLDGRLDLLQCNGHLEEEINTVQSSQHYQQPAQLFWNVGPQSRQCLVEVPEDSVGDLAKPIVGRGAAYADIDGDGDLDVLLTQVGRRPLLLRNDQKLGHHWLRVRLTGSTSNRNAIGSQLAATVAGRVLHRQVMPTRSYLSQVELPVTFGLGDADRVDELRIRWPGGGEQTLTNVPADQLLQITEQTTDAG